MPPEARGSAQTTTPVTTEKTKAIVASHRISPARVPSFAEIVEPILVNIICLLAVVVLVRTLPSP
jgi:hypothetical protein